MVAASLYAGTLRRKFMPYQYKREPLNNDEVNKLTNIYSVFRERFVIWPLLDTALTL
jgi:integrase/recombinase XerD